MATSFIYLWQCVPFRDALFVVLVWLTVGRSSVLAQVLMPSPAAKTNTVLLNGNWKFRYSPSIDISPDSAFYRPGFNTSNWATIRVPGNWELQGFAEPEYGRDLKEGTGLYRTTFTVPTAWRATPVYIAFDGVQYGYSLWVNGRYVGEFASSYNRQTFDITKTVEIGKPNVLAVRVTTRPKGWEFDTNDDWSLSGIIRDVTVFSLPAVHLNDLVVRTSAGNKTARIDIRATVEKTRTTAFPRNMKLFVQVVDPSGKVVGETTGNPANHSADTVAFFQSLTLDSPRLWTAETPHLYTIRLSLRDNATELQRYQERIGIREVTWANGVLKLNGTPIKLRGITHHDLSPVNGRAVTEPEMKQDLVLIQKANINFIRTSHYPPHPRLLSLCDSMGIYVMDEVPFGYGDDRLEDSTYLSILKNRAKATIYRDKNHACVIVWSVGNENPVTDITMKTARYVKQLDPTRPYCFPQTRGPLADLIKNYPSEIDILAPHYPNRQRAKDYAATLKHPVIFTEYAHALGLDFDLLDSLYEQVCRSPNLAGGAIWHFFDQGILRKSPNRIAQNEATGYAWKDSVYYYDTHGVDGADGIVYANRIPQVDYWQVRKVYSPIKALDDTLVYKAGKQTFSIRLMNRYDFTDLSETTCRWQLFADTNVLSSGTLPLTGKPHETAAVTLSATLPNKPAASFYYLKVSFTNKQNYQFYEKTYPIVSENHPPDLRQLMASKQAKPVVNGTLVTADNYRFDLNKTSGQFQLKNKGGVVVIAEGLYAQVGRKPTIAEEYFVSKPDMKRLLWKPYLLKKPQTSVVSNDAQKMAVSYAYAPDSAQGRSLAGTVTYGFSDSGYVHVNYKLTPAGKGLAVETGVAFLIPASLTEFRWIGQGPYQAYPGKARLDEFGFYHLNSSDLYFPGNRQQVKCAVFSDKKGNGFALIATDANIEVEQTADGIVVSHNAYVSGRYNKFGWPDLLYSFEKLSDISGSFTLVPLTENWPAALQKCLGSPTQKSIPFTPFYTSYDR